MIARSNTASDTGQEPTPPRPSRRGFFIAAAVYALWLLLLLVMAIHQATL